MQKITLYLLTTLLFMSSLQAQDITLRGRVLDAETETALPFTHVRLEGSEMGTATDINGYFSLRLSPKHKTAQIVVSYIGYQTQKVSIAEYLAQKQKIILLQPHESNLDNVVIEDS
ncbi:MAG: carboxypeptidase-like regulatory domain-containing protein [Bernardetiaceae bacterium]|nr:carboxypeptidase-like regulatory domain-containing protein [Bernardetiaceae bacterium]